MSLKNVHYLSRIFQPITIVSKNSNITRQDVTSKSQRLMLELGIIQQSCPGCFHLLPLGQRSLSKLINIVDQELWKIGGQKLTFPTLINSSLWKSSGRYKEMGPELMTLKDRHDHEYIISPTHEEVASALISSIFPISYKQFPLRLYQITSKFRDEMKPRFGLLRSREFLMKDMYSFDLDINNAKDSYETIRKCYDVIFDRIGVPYTTVLGTTGAMGGSTSHEYHFSTDIGEDKVLSCGSCGYNANVELSGDKSCPECGNSSNITIKHGIEVGHTFLLGDKYSKPLNARFLSKNAKPEILQMGSYGLGLTRILAASLEVLSSEQEMRWPDALAPYNVVILPPKGGSKEETLTDNLAENLYSTLEKELEPLKNNVLIDDRTSMTIGKRLIEAKRTGYRFIIVVNKRSAESPRLFEINDLRNNVQLYLSENELCKYISDNIEV